MPKYEVKDVLVDTKDKEGKATKRVERVWIPVDDAAWLEPVIEKGIEFGVLKDSDGSLMTIEKLKIKREKLKEMFHNRQIEDMKRRPQY